jgi:hypothetical protein
MLSQVIALERMRIYEKECRRQAACASDAISRIELSKFADTLGQALRELETILADAAPHNGVDDPDR